jgi:hypothetical protein
VFPGLYKTYFCGFSHFKVFKNFRFWTFINVQNGPLAKQNAREKNIKSIKIIFPWKWSKNQNILTSRNGLWVHKKKCNVIDLETEFKVLSNLVLDVIKKISLSKEVEIVK